MKRIFLALSICLLCALSGFAQQSQADPPASKEDVLRYLEVMHARETTAQTVEAMIKPVHQMLHEQYLKDKDKLPANFEEHMNKMMDEWLKSFPWDDLLQSMVPVYQKYFTKGDIDTVIAFYSGPVGQKLLRQMPAIMADSMQTMMPLLQRHLAKLKDRMQEEVAQIIKESGGKPDQKSQSSPN